MTTTAAEAIIDQLRRFVDDHPNLLVITGAGCSAPSGIPTYRDEDAEWRRSDPIQHADFVSKASSRRRYWNRSFAGWPAVRDAEPNDAHRCLARLESAGLVSLLVTQNVDGLHQKAGHARVVDLHGRLDRVICLDCGDRTTRENMQVRLADANPHLSPKIEALTPDGDADIDSEGLDVAVPACRACDGTLKPDVVFFGGSVPRPIVQDVFDTLDTTSGVLVIGSSLMVYSGYRFCKVAAKNGIPIAIVNRGRTRADDLANLKINDACETTLRALVNVLNV